MSSGEAPLSDQEQGQPATYGTIKKPKERPVSAENPEYRQAEQVTASQSW